MCPTPFGVDEKNQKKTARLKGRACCRPHLEATPLLPRARQAARAAAAGVRHVLQLRQGRARGQHAGDGAGTVRSDIIVVDAVVGGTRAGMGVQGVRHRTTTVPKKLR